MTSPRTFAKQKGQNKPPYAGDESKPPGPTGVHYDCLFSPSLRSIQLRSSAGGAGQERLWALISSLTIL